MAFVESVKEKDYNISCFSSVDLSTVNGQGDDTYKSLILVLIQQNGLKTTYVILYCPLHKTIELL
jgi:hypothetical protein